MRKKTFTVLLALCVLAAAATAAYIYLSRPDAPEVPMGALLYPDLDVNQVARIDVASRSGDFSVKRTDAGWLAGADFYYPADFTKLARFLKGLSELKVGRAFTADRETLERLSLVRPGDDKAPEKAKAGRFDLYDGKGDKILSLLVGAAREGREQQQVGNTQYRLPAGQYMRKDGSDRVYVVDRFFEMEEQNPADWMDKLLTRVDASDVIAMALYKVEKGSKSLVWEVARPEKGKDFAAVSFPPGEKLARSEVNRMAQFLSALSFDQVRKAEPDAGYEGHMFNFTLQNGVVYSVRMAAPSTPLGCQVAISTAYEPDRAVSDTLEKTTEAIAREGDGEMAKSEGASPDPAQDKAGEIRASVEKTNAQFSPWVFTLGKWRCDSLLRSAEDLLEK